MINGGAEVDNRPSPCHSTKEADTTSSTATLQTCKCGPECGAERCSKGNKQQHPIWDQWQHRVFLGFIGVLGLWVIIYFSVTLTTGD